MNELSAAFKKVREQVLPEAIKDAAIQTGLTAVHESPRFSGQLRASTKIGINSVDSGVVLAPVYEYNAIPDAEARAARGFSAAISGYSLGDTIYISNNQPYASEQEYEAGHLMFTKAAQMFNRELDRSLRNAA